MTQTYLAVMDFETTGLRPERDLPLSVGVTVVDLERGTVLDQFEERIRHSRWQVLRRAPTKAFREAQTYHKIPTRDMYTHGTPVEEVTRELTNLQRYYDDLRGNGTRLAFAAHNVAFDWAALNHLYRLAGEKNPYNYHLVDLPTLGRLRFGKTGLRDIAECLGIPVNPIEDDAAVEEARQIGLAKTLNLPPSQCVSHTALYDARLTAECFLRMHERMQDDQMAAVFWRRRGRTRDPGSLSNDEVEEMTEEAVQ